jgi:hypothetical protein
MKKRSAAGQTLPNADRSIADPSKSRLARSRVDHEGIDFAEHDVDAARDAGHNRAGRNSHKPRHQCVFNQILTFAVLPDLPVNDKTYYSMHFFSPSPYGELVRG